MDSNLTFEEILKQQKKTGVKRPKPVKDTSDKHRYDNEAPVEMSSKRPKKMSHFYEKTPYSVDPR